MSVHPPLILVRLTTRAHATTLLPLTRRMGASAMLMSNKASWAGRAKYKLVRSIRVHTGKVDDAYK